jgi:hypothetical protein
LTFLVLEPDQFEAHGRLLELRADRILLRDQPAA